MCAAPALRKPYDREGNDLGSRAVKSMSTGVSNHESHDDSPRFPSFQRNRR